MLFVSTSKLFFKWNADVLRQNGSKEEITALKDVGLLKH